MPLHIVHNDITKMHTDIIVNAANNQLLQGGGVCGAIFKSAGEDLLKKECQTLSPVQTGSAVITDGYHSNAKYIVHAVGPIYKDGLHNEEVLLKSAYQTSLDLAIQYKCKSISFPLISAGIYGYPKKEALDISVKTLSQFLETNDLDIYLVVYDRNAVTLSEQLYHNIEHYIDTYYVETRFSRSNEIYGSFSCNAPLAKPKSIKKKRHFFKDDISLESEKVETTRSLDSLVDMIDETFSEMLLRLIDEKGYTDSVIYKKANIDRKLFSKIRTQTHYHPSKKTALALAIALQLSLDETLDLLNKAGYTLSNSQKSDIIIKYFIENNNYDIYTINEALFCFNEPTL